MRKTPSRLRAFADTCDPFLIGIVILALAVRIWSLDFGLPYRYHVDEPPQVLAALTLAKGDFRIDYPPLSPNMHQVLLFILFAILFVFQRFLGIVHSPLEFAGLYQQDPTAFYLLARGLSVASSVLALIMLYVLARRTRGRRTAVVASFFLALCFLDVRHAHFGKLYPLLSLLVLACVYLAIRYVQTGRHQFMIAAGAVSGTAIGLRYSMLPLGSVPLVAIFLQSLENQRADRRNRAFVSVGHLLWSIPLGILIGTPSLILNTQSVLSNFRTWAVQAVGPGGFYGFRFTDMPSWEFYIRILETAWGIPLLMALLLGLGRIIARHRGQDFILFLFPVSYGVVLLLAPSASSAFARYLVPVLPFLAMIAAEGTGTVADWLFGEKSIPIKTVVLSALVAGLVFVPVIRIVRLNRLWAQLDTRTLAKRWIEANIPEGAKIAEQWHGPPLATESDPEPYSLRTYAVEVLDPFTPASELYSIGYYQDNGFEYLVLSSFIYKLDRVDPAEDALRTAFYKSLERDAELVAEFRPCGSSEEPPFFFEHIWGPMIHLTRFERPGPAIKIYRLL